MFVPNLNAIPLIVLITQNLKHQPHGGAREGGPTSSHLGDPRSASQ